MKKRNLLYLLPMFLLMLILVNGCSSGEQEDRKVDVSGENDYTTVAVSAVTPMTDNTSYYGVFYAYTNETEETVAISQIMAEFTDKTGTVISNEETRFAPNVLEPGETGYGGVIVYNPSSEYDLENINATITPDFFYSEEGYADFDFENTLTVSDAVISEIPYDSLMTDGKGVTVEVENTGTETQTPQVVCGLLNEDSEVIGFAANLTASPLDPGAKEQVICESILVYPDNDLDLVKNIVPRVKNADI